MYCGVPRESPVSVRRLPPASLTAQRDAEVGQHRLALEQENVLGLDVAVDDAVAVGVVERARDLPGDRQRLVQAELVLAVELVAERLAPDVREDVVEEAFFGARVDQGEDVRVVEPGGDLDLGQEPLDAEDRAELGAEHLERDFAVVLEIGGEEDGGHAAGAELALDPVALLERGGQPTEVAHAGLAGTGGSARGPAGCRRWKRECAETRRRGRRRPAPGSDT